MFLRASLQELDTLWRLRLDERVPLQYLTNAAHWRDMVLAVQPGVLIPRPETELLIDFASAAVQRRPELGARPWVDLGTGSGALALGAARAVAPRGHVWAVDLSDTAVRVARHNAARLGLEHRVSVLQGSWADPLPEELRGSCGGVLSNPPYIARETLSGLQAEVTRHEPWLALDGGAGEALGCLQAVTRAAASLLAPGGFLALEMGGRSQAERLVQDMERQGAFVDIEIRSDYAGIARFVVAYRA